MVSEYGPLFFSTRSLNELKPFCLGICCHLFHNVTATMFVAFLLSVGSVIASYLLCINMYTNHKHVHGPKTSFAIIFLHSCKSAS